MDKFVSKDDLKVERLDLTEGKFYDYLKKDKDS